MFKIMFRNMIFRNICSAMFGTSCSKLCSWTWIFGTYVLPRSRTYVFEHKFEYNGWVQAKRRRSDEFHVLKNISFREHEQNMNVNICSCSEHDLEEHGQLWYVCKTKIFKNGRKSISVRTTLIPSGTYLKNIFMAVYRMPDKFNQKKFFIESTLKS